MDISRIVSQWRSWIRPLVVILYVVSLIIALPLMIIEFRVHETKTQKQAWFIGLFFVLLALPISFWGILQHLIHWTNPLLQRHIIRILWMVPIYAGDAWFALRFKDSSIYLDTLRECYEAYVIYNFMTYLMCFLLTEYPNLEVHLSQKPQVKHLIPFCIIPQWKMGRSFIQHCRHGVLQYTVIRILTTCIALICQLSGVYKEGEFSFKAVWLYITFINNASQIWAMYCLILFYRATKAELSPLNPISKFLCVKTVVFLSFWQQVLIAGLTAIGVIKANTSLNFTTDDIANGLQDFCICVEMFFAAVAHYYSFSHKPYIDVTANQGDCFSSFLDMWDVSDVHADMVDHVRHIGAQVVRPLRNNRSRTGEREPLITGNCCSETRDIDAEIQSVNSMNSMCDIASIQTTDPSRKKSLIESCDIADQYQQVRPYSASLNNFADFSVSSRTSENICDKASNEVPSDSSSNKLSNENDLNHQTIA